MRIERLAPAILAFAVAALLAVITASLAVRQIESRSQSDVARVLDLNGAGWVEVDVDGLQVMLNGLAKDEAARFHAMRTAATVIDATRVIDMMNVEDESTVTPPDFIVEILRNGDGISLIGLLPQSTDREALIERITELADGATVTDLLDVANFEAPENWERALSFSVTALADFERSKISVSPDRVEFKAISDSIDEKRRIESKLNRQVPGGIDVVIDISAPRPVITPFATRFLIDDEGPRFDACSTDTSEGQAKIIAAARYLGVERNIRCKIGLGVPSHEWDDAVVTGITKLKEIGFGTISFSDADVTLVADAQTPRSIFERVAAELDEALPDVFSLKAILAEPVNFQGQQAEIIPPEFVATRSPEGQVQLRGRIATERGRIATVSFAQAQFGSSLVNGTLLLDETVPNGWSSRVLASVESLAFLSHGSVTASPDVVEIRGTTGDPDAKAEITRILSSKLGDAADFRIDVTYEEKLDPELNLPTAEDCVKNISLVLGIRQITFEPSSADIDNEARETVDNIAKIMKQCSDFPMEIGGHTDSQGREVMNQALSQSRADAVLNALLARRILTSNLTSKGYGEAAPIADNGTEEGREANRRIEFKLITPEETAEVPSTETAQDPTTDAESTDEQN